MGWRYIAQRSTTGDFLDWDVPFVATSLPKRELSGPGEMRGTIEPEYLRLLAKPDGLPIIGEWATTLYAEYDGHIRWGGLVTSLGYEGQKMNIGCSGYTAYPHGMPYFGSGIQAAVKIKEKWAYDGKDKNHDGYIDGTRPKRKMPKRPKDKISPRWESYDVFRHIWAHLQSYHGGNLGVTIDKHDSGHLLGASNGEDPWTLNWWDFPDCGDTIDEVMRLAKADYMESHRWDGSKEKVIHHIDLGHKRLGRQRTDLRFAQGENIVEIATPSGQGDEFANTVYALGKGVGRKTAKVRLVRDDKRLRRARVFTFKSTANLKLLTEYGQTQLSRHSEQITIPSIAIKQHQNAPLGSWCLGDRILVQVEIPWLGELALWHRIMAEEIDPAAGAAILTLARSDHYG
ncbi:hypothetical protein ACFUJY_29210 [Streptomyces sp. NPDC057249]|uniref:hypothetical protein n=1 Tax=Streptomyces sp. NPDC057249 TaxID=3346067 RepID=UPI003644A72D